MKKDEIVANEINNIAVLPETGFIRLHNILKIFPVSKASWWRGVKDGRYPKPVKIAPRITAWKAEDIKNLIDKYN